MQNILVDMDSLLDTRLGTFHTIDPAVAVGLEANPNYRSRVADDWNLLVGSDIAKKFAKKYQGRNNDVLKSSVMTALIFFLHSLYGELAKALLTTPVGEEMVLTINTHPYVLSSVEREELTNTLHEYISPFVDVQYIDIPMTGLSPSYLHDKYSAVVMYDFDSWLNYHYAGLQARPIPRLTLYVPALFAKTPDLELIKKSGVTGVGGPYSLTEAGLAELVGVSFIDSSHFSMIDVI